MLSELCCQFRSIKNISLWPNALWIFQSCDSISHLSQSTSKHSWGCCELSGTSLKGARNSKCWYPHKNDYSGRDQLSIPLPYNFSRAETFAYSLLQLISEQWVLSWCKCVNYGPGSSNHKNSDKNDVWPWQQLHVQCLYHSVVDLYVMGLWLPYVWC